MTKNPSYTLPMDETMRKVFCPEPDIHREKRERRAANMERKLMDAGFTSAQTWAIIELFEEEEQNARM